MNYFFTVFSLIFVTAFSFKTYKEPAKLKDSGNLCEYLPHSPTIWGYLGGGKKAEYDSVANVLNSTRETYCDYHLSQTTNTLRIKMAQVFEPNDPVKRQYDYAERYREFTRNGEIVAYLYVAPDGSYMGHDIEKGLLMQPFEAIANDFPFYKLAFSPAIENQKNIADTVKMIVYVELNEELFLGN